MEPSGESAVEQAKRDGRWPAPDRPVDISMPAEFTSRLQSDTQAAEFFESLAP